MPSTSPSLLKKPTVSRSFAAVVGVIAVAGVVIPTHARATETLTEQDAVAAALTQPGWKEATNAARTGANERAKQARLWRNPQLQYNRGHVPGVEVEQSIMLQQTIDISGRRGRRSQAQVARGRASVLTIQRRRRVLAGRVRALFYTRLAAELRRAVLVDWTRRLQDTLSMLDKRLKAGVTSRYARLRVARELRLARARTAVVAAAIAAQTAQLAAYMGRPSATLPPCSGALMPPAPTTVGLKVKERADIQAAVLRARAAGLTAAAAERQKFPIFQVGAGWRSLSGPGASGHGYVVQLNARLPIANSGTANAAANRATAASLRAQARLTARTARANLAANARRWALLRTAATAFDAARQRDNPPMLTAANAGFRGGALRITAVLDAHRAATEDALQAIALQAQARAAQLQHRLAAGQGAKP